MKNIPNPKALLVALHFLFILSSCHDQDALRCLPDALHVGNDDIKYKYDGQRRVVALEYYDSPSNSDFFQQYELVYNASGQLYSVTRTYTTGNPQQREMFVLEYGTDGLPETMERTSIDLGEGKEVTEFTHNSDGTVQSATTNFVHPAFPEPTLRGAYRYEYTNGNVVKVFYTVRTFNGVEEVLARENFTFDDKAVFFGDPAGLKTMNIYCFQYMPNTNNVLTASVTWLNYGTYFQAAQNITFSPTYDQDGRIISNTANSPSATPSFGELVFSGLSYSCQ